jgi:MFS transporter, PAT family, beta-lactamase induction signal transducer AmpG
MAQVDVNPSISNVKSKYAVYASVFSSKSMLAMLLLGFASGLPLALSTGTLQAWLTVEGLNIKTIGYLTLAGLPYTFKFIWAPLVDRFELPVLGRRRAWLVVTQLLLAVACWVMATLDPKLEIGLVAACAVAVAFLSASQDIVFDAYRSDLMKDHERGAGAAVSVLGYRLAMLVSGGLALIIADQWLGWANMYRAMGGLFILMAAVSVWAPNVEVTNAEKAPVKKELLGFFAMIFVGLFGYLALREAIAVSVPSGWAANKFVMLAIEGLHMMVSLMAGIFACRAVGFPSFVKPWDAFFSRKHAAWLLTFIVLYKLGDAFAGALSTSFLIRGVGFTATEVGTMNKVLGLIATLVGALLGGLWLIKQSLYKALLWFGIAQAVSNLAYWVLAVSPKSYWLMGTAVGIENLCGGMGTAAFVAFLMALTQKEFSAAQFALLSALAAVARTYVGPVSGVLVADYGWPTFFIITVFTALPGIGLLIFLKSTILAMSPAVAISQSSPD